MIDSLTPIGRNPNQLTANTLRDMAAFQDFKNDMLTLPPANSNANAKLHRQALLKHASPKARADMMAIFKGNGLDF